MVPVPDVTSTCSRILRVIGSERKSMSRFYEFDNGVCIDFDKVESVGRSITKNSYLKSYGAMYTLHMVSGDKHDVYEFVEEGAPTYGTIVMRREKMLELLRKKD
jgi:hypothetical protein